MFIKRIFLLCMLFGFSLAGDSQTSFSAGGLNDNEKIVSHDTAYGSSTGDSITPPSPAVLPVIISTTPTKSSTTTSAPTKPSTTTSAPTPSTTTSAPTPSTTTSAPTPSTTTSAPTPSTTTSAPTPSTTTSAPTPSTTTSAPTPMPPTPAPTIPEVWNVTDSAKNITCIIAKMDILLEIHQENMTTNFTGSPKTKKVKAQGECGANIQTLEITWPHDNNFASLLFSFNSTENKYFVSSLTTTISLNTSAGSEAFNDTQHLNLYETGKNTSYSCPSYVLNFEANKTSLKLSMNEIQIEAFRSTNSTKFSSANHCNGEVPDIVPLIVGLALAGLVIVVVIGYFIGRRRSQARGYLSM